jgi:hypothetical protein
MGTDRELRETDGSSRVVEREKDLRRVVERAVEVAGDLGGVLARRRRP